MIIGSLGAFILIFVGMVIFSGVKLTLLGLLVVTAIYGIARWRVGYPCWDNPDGPIKSGLATLLFICIAYERRKVSSGICDRYGFGHIDIVRNFVQKSIPQSIYDFCKIPAQNARLHGMHLREVIHPGNGVEEKYFFP